MTPRPIPAVCLQARRALDAVPGYELLNDVSPVPGVVGVWTFSFALTLQDLRDTRVPSRTVWHAVIDDAYPRGRVEIYPDRAEGLAETFPHQLLNTEGDLSVPWRAGKLCLDTSLRVLGREAWDREPYEPGARVRWHVERSVEWLRAAAADRLIAPGEPLELPAYPSGGTLVAFAEDGSSFASWTSAPRTGRVHFLRVARGERVLAVRSFATMSGKPVLKYEWGTHLQEQADANLKGFWLRIPKMPVIDPWQPPRSWGELVGALKGQGVDLLRLLRQWADELRVPGALLMLGFPLERLFGEAPEQLHWLALQLPQLPSIEQKRPGFTVGESGRWLHDMPLAFGHSRSLLWHRTENWALREQSSRGQLGEALRRRRVAIIGAGALGSHVADLLVRGGVHDVTIVDGDEVGAGNLVRHTMTLPVVTMNKADAVGAWLNASSPHARVSSVSSSYPSGAEAIVAVNRADLVIDCTAEDAVLHALGTQPSVDADRWYASVSMGIRGTRVFCLWAIGRRLDPTAAFTALTPYLRDEAGAFAEMGLLREGIGCWHPVIPTRVTEIAMAAGIAVAWLDEQSKRREPHSRLTVFSQQADLSVVRADQVLALTAEAPEGGTPEHTNPRTGEGVADTRAATDE